MPNGFTIMMLHAGMRGQVPHLHGGLTPGQLEPLRPAVDYLALGHVHKRLQEDWIFNPGSLETNSMEEIDWPHGFFDVQVDTDSDPKFKVSPIEIEKRRPFHRIVAATDGDDSLDEFVALAETRIAEAKDIEPSAVIELVLSGIAGFPRQDIPLERLKAEVETRFAPLLVRVRNALAPPGVVQGPRHGDRMTRADLERQIVEQIVYQRAEYRDRATAWARLILDVKNMAVEKDLPASIADHVSTAIADLENLEPSAIEPPPDTAEAEAVETPAQEPDRPSSAVESEPLPEPERAESTPPEPLAVGSEFDAPPLPAEDW
jgi:DNA repair exonuclease SbcCD nuclease subunit